MQDRGQFVATAKDSPRQRPKLKGRLLLCFPKLVVASVLCVYPVLMAPPVFADEFSRVSQYSVRLFSFGTLTLDTRVGDIYVEGWDDPHVRIESEKVVRAKSEEKAERQYGRIRIQIQGQDEQVLVRTIYPPRRLWRPFRGESKLSVNFRIKMPYDANLVLKCVDGDVQVEGLVGNEQLSVNYGDVEIAIPSTGNLRLLNARTWLGYVQSDVGGKDQAGIHQRLKYWNPKGSQEINVHVRFGGVFVYVSGN